MALQNDFFSDFPPVSKDEWLQQIARDLKGKRPEELDWEAEPGLKVSPFVHADDFTEPPLALSDEPNDWKIAEDIPVTDAVQGNRQALEALEGGAEDLEFHFSGPPGAADFQHLMAGIYPDYIGLHFTGPGVAANPGAILSHLEQLCASGGVPSRRLRGSLGYDPASAGGIADWRYLADLLEFAKEKFPGFRLVTLQATAGAEGAAGVSQILADLLRQGDWYLQKLSGRGVSAAYTAGTLQFSWQTGQSYFLEIAALRAFKLLWLNVLKAWELPLQWPYVAARFRPGVYTGELYGNMIRATTLAMSAVLGGADRLTVLPYDAGREAQATYPPEFGRRIARNVQHLLKLESHLDEIPDPAAGSYYLEKLTVQLAGKAWEDFSGTRR